MLNTIDQSGYQVSVVRVIKEGGMRVIRVPCIYYIYIYIIYKYNIYILYIIHIYIKFSGTKLTKHKIHYILSKSKSIDCIYCVSVLLAIESIYYNTSSILSRYLPPVTKG